MTAAVVELDLYSGAPNPRWTLDAAQASELFETVAALEVATDAPAASGRLGYRGIRVRPVDGDRSPLHFADGYVHIGRDRVVETRVDHDRRIERRLLEGGAEWIDRGMLNGLLATFAGEAR